MMTWPRSHPTAFQNRLESNGDVDDEGESSNKGGGRLCIAGKEGEPSPPLVREGLLIVPECTLSRLACVCGVTRGEPSCGKDRRGSNPFSILISNSSSSLCLPDEDDILVAVVDPSGSGIPAHFSSSSQIVSSVIKRKVLPNSPRAIHRYRSNRIQPTERTNNPMYTKYIRSWLGSMHASYSNVLAPEGRVR